MTRILITLIIVVGVLALYAWKWPRQTTPTSLPSTNQPVEEESDVTTKLMIEAMRPIGEKSILPAIKIVAKPSEKTTLTESKLFGRSFYFPTGEAIPNDAKGRPMALLAQINFAEMPPLEGYPESGILQIFISAYDDLYGNNYEGFSGDFDFAAQKGYQVRYYPKISSSKTDLETDFSFLPQLNNESGERLLLPGETECSLNFASIDQAVTTSDYRFERYFPTEFFEQFPGLEQYDAMDIIDEDQELFGHQIGGYASFTQTDPRSYAKPEKNWLLLLQIDSDDDAKIMWGDVGVANFFITPEDLAARDFSKVIYNWDCY